MNKVIYKFQFAEQDDFKICLPKNSQILCVQMQDEIPCMWTLMDKNEKAEVRHFRVFGTGHYFALSNYKYIGTFQLFTGSLVFHLFEDII